MSGPIRQSGGSLVSLYLVQAQSEPSCFAQSAAVLSGGDKTDGASEQENTSFRDAAELLRSDAALTAEVLRLANSPMAALRFPTTNLLQALSVLGVNRIASLTTTLCVGRLLKPVAKLPLMRRCWRHNLATALIASQWSGEYKVDSEKAYTFGLLAGLGRLALLVSDPAAYSRLTERAQAEMTTVARRI